MEAREVVALIALLEEHGLEVYVDGGWAVDALLGRQTRSHGDLDIALPDKHVPQVRNLLGRRGYQEKFRIDSWESNFVLADAKGNEVDVHSYALDEAGNNAHGVAYVREHLTGNGSILSHPVRCVSPEWLVKFHTGYGPDANDYQDVRALCERFGIALPDEYLKFTKDG